MQLWLFEDYVPPVDPAPVEELAVETIGIGDLSGQPMFELFVPVARSVETLREQLPTGLSNVELDYPGYAIELLQKWEVTPMTFPLDNVPTGDSSDQKTSLSEARVTLTNFWNECKFVALDVFSFAEVVYAREGGYTQFLEKLRAQYQPYFHTVIILFADQVRLGQEEYHVVLRIDDGCQRATLTAYPGDKTFNLAAQQREAILMACVPAEAVILRPDFVRPKPQLVQPRPQALLSAPTLALTEVVDCENDPRYAFRFSDWANSGLSRDEFVQQRGSDAYVLVETAANK